MADEQPRAKLVFKLATLAGEISLQFKDNTSANVVRALFAMAEAVRRRQRVALTIQGEPGDAANTGPKLARDGIRPPLPPELRARLLSAAQALQDADREWSLPFPPRPVDVAALLTQVLAWDDVAGKAATNALRMIEQAERETRAQLAAATERAAVAERDLAALRAAVAVTDANALALGKDVERAMYMTLTNYDCERIGRRLLTAIARRASEAPETPEGVTPKQTPVATGEIGTPPAGRPGRTSAAIPAYTVLEALATEGIETETPEGVQRGSES